MVGAQQMPAIARRDASGNEVQRQVGVRTIVPEDRHALLRTRHDQTGFGRIGTGQNPGAAVGNRGDGKLEVGHGAVAKPAIDDSNFQ